MPLDLLTHRSILVVWITRFASTLFIGVVLSLFSVLLLAELGLYFPFIDLVFIFVLTLTGVLLGLFRDKGSALFFRSIKEVLPGVVVFVLSIAVIMALPRAGEWVLGGWDPGVYENQGIMVERTGTFYPEAHDALAELGYGGLKHFTRGNDEYHEYLPGVPIDLETSRIEHYFFRLTPSFIAMTTRCGGIRAAVRLNMFVGFFGVVLFSGFLFANGAKTSHIVIALLLYVTQPIWLYHQHLPTSEMLQLFLVSGIGFFVSVRSSRYGNLFLSIAFFAAILNRISFLPFACLLLLVLSWLDSVRSDRRCVLRERIEQSIAILFGLVFDLTVTSVTIIRLKSLLPILLIVSVVTYTLAIIIDTLGVNANFRSKMRRFPVLPCRLFYGAVILLIALIWFFASGNIALLSGISNNLHGLAPYMGYGILILSVFSLWPFFCRAEARGLRGFVFFLCSVAAVSMIDTHIKELYPWVIRRYITSLFPAVCILAGYGLSFLWQSKRHKYVFKLIVLVLLLCVLGENAKKSWHAWSCTEYDGASVVLAAIAEQIKDRDIVVVDDPVWGTPLSLIHGKQIFDGKHLWRRKSVDGMEEGLSVLSELREKGWRIRFLTSTLTSGLDIYPVKLGSTTLDWESGEVVLECINHSRRADDFDLKKKHNVFRLFSWHG